MVNQLLSEFLDEQNAEIGAKYLYLADEDVEVAGVYSDDKVWLVVTHNPDWPTPRKQITHLEEGLDMDQLENRYYTLVKEVKENPQMYMVKGE